MQSKYNCVKDTKLLGQIHFHEQIGIDVENIGSTNPNENRILLLHTGGTIGMFLNENNKFSPMKERFKQFLSNYPYFCDEDETYFNSQDGFSITPPSLQNKKIWYKFKELDNLIDSSNINLDKLNELASLIQESYEKYDAFIILHGTDTMSFTASALSFMIENLKKTVIITGAQIPIGQTRNDSANNLLCSLTIAGHYCIPEVLVIFDNFILRGNRSTKISASALTAFRSPNFYPIGKLGLKIQIQWEHIFPCTKDKPTKFHKLKEQVGLVKLTPFGFENIPTSKYLVVQSYGIGNIPTDGPFYEWVKKNRERPENQRTIIVNISQASQSVILNLYATGDAAYKLGMIPGSDMTCEAAVAKLSFLATMGYKDEKHLQELMTTNMRGELTEAEDRKTKNRQNYVTNCLTLLDKHFSSQSQKFKDILIKTVYPTLVIEGSSKASVARLIQYGFDIHYVYCDNSNILHNLMKMISNLEDVNHDTFFNYLLDQGIDVKLVDKHGNSALFYAVEKGNYEAAQKIKEKGGILATSVKRVFKAIKDQDLALLNALVKFEDPFHYKNQEGRNCAFYAVIHKKYKVCNFLNNFTHLFNEENRKATDLYGSTLQFYMEKFEYSPGQEFIEFHPQQE